MDGLYGRPAAELPPAVAGHFDVCARCRRIYRWVLDGEPAGEIAPATAEQVATRLCSSLKPVKPLPPTRVLATRFVCIFLALAALLLLYVGVRGMRDMSPPQLLIVGGILGFAAVFLSVSLSWQIVPGQGQRIPVPMLIAAFLGGFALVVAALFPWEGGAQLLSAGWSCTTHGLAMALPMGIILLYLASRGAPLSYETLGASLGAVSGLLGLTVLQFSCDNQHAGHLILWHGSVVVICVVTGYLFGRLAHYIAIRHSG